MRTLALIFAILIALSSPAETLRDLLKNNGIPENSFSNIELDDNVNGTTGSKDPYVLIAYIRLNGELLTGSPHLVRYDRKSGAILRSEVKPEDEVECCGSPEGIRFIGDFAVLSFHINPSAEAMLVLGKDLKLVTTLYGFDIHEVAKEKVVFIENMIHFAPVHPERLQLADLHTGKRAELYPPAGDLLRARFARDHAGHMPSQATCEKLDDPCKPELYDEDIDFIDTDGNGSFAFTVHRNAVHAMAGEQEPESVVSDTTLYRYAWNGNGWLYCEEELSSDEERTLGGVKRQDDISKVKSDCKPALSVSPDISTSDYSPFENHRRK